jgi:hypothetical protein
MNCGFVVKKERKELYGTILFQFHNQEWKFHEDVFFNTLKSD